LDQSIADFEKPECVYVTAKRQNKSATFYVEYEVPRHKRTDKKKLRWALSECSDRTLVGDDTFQGWIAVEIVN
jgi:hypothetical protein